MSALEMFTSGDWSVRTEVRDGEPWFVAADVCQALGIVNPSSTIALLDDDEKGLHSVETLGGTQQVVVINEPGLYSLVLRSRRQEAKTFKRWITHDVLPAIRRTGSYSTAPALPSYPEALRQLAAEIERTSVLEQALAEATPKAALADDLLSADGDYDVRTAAQLLSSRAGVDVGAGRLRDYLQQIGWLDRRNRLPMQAQINCGRLAVRATTFTNADGIERVNQQVRVTPKGLQELHKRMAAPRLTVLNGGQISIGGVS